MHEGIPNFLTTFAVVLCTAAFTTVVCQWLKQPVILGYLLAGLLIGPHVAVPLVADQATIETLAELGVILLLFGIGLEFSIRRLMRVGGPVVITAIIDVSLMAWLGIGAARLLGWSPREALFTGAMLAISSTTIIAKTFDERGVERRLRDLVFGVLIVEDLVAVLFLAGLATLGGGGSEASSSLLGTLARLVALLLVWVTVGLVLIPRGMRRLIKKMRPETTLVASIGLCFAFALLARALGYSVALGAFIAGSMISESGKGEQVVKLVQPVRDIFAAVFFVAVGMLIDPKLVMEHWGAVMVLTLVVVLGKVISVSLGAFFAGQGTRTSVQAGLSMAQIGEFSFIIASLGLVTGAVRPFLYPVAVAVSAITTLSTPWLVRGSPAIVSFVDRKLPKPLQTYATLYGSWIEEIRASARQRSHGQRIGQLVRWIFVDAAVVSVIIIATSMMAPQLIAGTIRRFDLGASASGIVLGTAALILAAPFLLGIARTGRRLAVLLATAALPRGEGMDRAAAPRGALVLGLEIAILLLAGLPVLAVTGPFLPPFRGAVVLAMVLLFLAIAAWRSARNLDGHVRAGSEVLIAAVRSTLPPEHETAEMQVPTLEGSADRFATATHMLPGIGMPTPFRLEQGHYGVGLSLAELGLRARTGATILAITRSGAGIPAPSKEERLEVNDTLVLVGTRVAIDAAREMLVRG
ncbi:MAG: cation:proton antiporter [Gemmatimonadota bacterium]